MERQIPKNVRQIGNVSGTPKIYVEDYVDTFFTQLCEKTGEEPAGAFLVGEIQKTEEEEYIYIYGAIKMYELKFSENEYIIDEDTWKRAYEDCKQYFEDGEMLGWFVAHEGVHLKPDINMIRLHKKSFPKENTIFVMKDPVEKEEAYFVHKFSELLEMGGHYTYYEKNPCMQNYMISTRKKNGVCASETVEDRAAKDFRSLVRTREERRQQKRENRAMYLMSASLVLVVVVMGVVTMNNFDKMQLVQNTLNALSSSVAADKENSSQEGKESSDDKLLAQTNEDAQENNPDVDKSSDVSGPDPDAVQETSGSVTAVQGDSGQADGGEAGNLEENVMSSDVSSQSPQNVGGITEENYSYPSAGEEDVYIVEEGDTLALISQKIYGDISQIDTISEMNGLTDGNLIYIGQKLLLP